jgi:RNA polymerase sigma factor (sigma-70 family)
VDSEVPVDQPDGVRSDDEQFAAVYDRYAPMLFRYAARRLGRDQAEDAVSETFLTAFADRSRFDPERGQLRAWLFGILTHKISRQHRAETARYRMLAVLPSPVPAADAAERAVEAAWAASARSALAAALATLAPADRDVLLLIAWADLSYPEVAEVLGVPVGTVRSRLHRARRTLRRDLPGLGVPDRLAEPVPFPERGSAGESTRLPAPEDLRS